MLTFFSEYAPHGYCLLWEPSLIWTHVVSDALIALSYLSIPAVLLMFLRSRSDIEFRSVALLFAVFILSCGFTHMMSLWNLWHGDYGIEALAKAVTAIASVPTAMVLWKLLPRALLLPSPSLLTEKNVALAAALAERDVALAQVRDEIEQRERAEAALVQSKKIEAIGQLTGGIAHDFNNLLQGIKGYVELIEMFPHQGDNVLAWAGNAAQAVERGTKLTGQLLTFSRQQRLQAEAICIGAMLSGMDELIHNSVGPRIEVNVQVEDDLGVVMSDRNQLELAILNLAINARDAMPHGGQLLIVAERRDAEVMISVRDNGTGMSEDVAEHAFEPFYTTKEPGRGTGLGLSTVYGLAQQAGGSVTIESKPGIGTNVSMFLPRGEPRSPCPAATHIRLTPELTRAGLGTLLVVDDDESVRAALSNVLLAAGYEVHQASCGQSALDLLEQREFDLLLLDFAMPCMNGAEVAKLAFERRPEQCVLFLTGYADSEALDAAIYEAEADHAKVLKKPISAADLGQAVAEMLAASSLQDSPQIVIDEAERERAFVGAAFSRL